MSQNEQTSSESVSSHQDNQDESVPSSTEYHVNSNSINTIETSIHDSENSNIDTQQVQNQNPNNNNTNTHIHFQHHDNTKYTMELPKLPTLSEWNTLLNQPLIPNSSQHSIFNQRKKQSLNVVFVGNSGSGITTLLGYLTFICGGMDWKSIEPMWFGMGIARDTDQSPYRYLIDSPQDCHTKELHTIRLETKHFILNCISVPTQRKYEKLLLRGMFRADVAVIVVNINDAQLVRREWKFTDQIMALKSCGVVQSIVCVNMLDKNPSEDLFTHTASEILQIMKKQNMNIADTKVIACSALNGFGIVENINTEWNWYKGETLIEALDALKPHERPVWHPLRMVVEKVKQGQRHEQLILTGRVICGVLRVGMKLCFSDKSLYFLNAPPPRIVSIQCFGQECEEAFPGDFVGILLETHDSNSNNTLLLSHIRRGTVVSDRSAEHQALQVKSFQAQVIVVHCPNRIRAGFTPLLHNQEFHARLIESLPS